VTYGVCLAVAGVVGTAMLPREIEDREVPEHFIDPPLSEHSEEGLGIHYPVVDGPANPGASRPLGLRSRAFAAALAINLGNGWMLYGVRNALVPAYVTDQLHHTAVWAGGAFFLASLVQVAVLFKAGGLADSRGRRPAMIIGAASALVASAVLVLPAHTAAFLLAMAGLGVAAAFISSAPAAVVGDVAQGAGGRGVALFSMASDFGAVVGPLLAGFLADRYSYSVAFGSSVIVLSFSLFCCLIMQETRQPRPAQ
jgi:MFS family permease